MLRRTRTANFDLHLRENRNGPVHRTIWGFGGPPGLLPGTFVVNLTLGVWPPDPPKKNFEFFFEFLEQIRSRSAVRNEPRHDGSPRSWVLHASPQPFGGWGPRKCEYFSRKFGICGVDPSEALHFYCIILKYTEGSIYG
jgi:hypothetical protein